jgi:hypothetical protein
MSVVIPPTVPIMRIIADIPDGSGKESRTYLITAAKQIWTGRALS